MKNLFTILIVIMLILGCNENSIDNVQSSATSNNEQNVAPLNATGRSKATASETQNPSIHIDFIYHNAKVYTVDADNSWAEALAVSLSLIHI